MTDSTALDREPASDGFSFADNTACLPYPAEWRPAAAPERASTGRRSPLKLIADLVGVSKMTVSRALRGGTNVEAELRNRILNAAREMGYQSDPRISQVMRAIRKSQTPCYRETLALLWTHQRGEEKRSGSFFEELLTGANRRALELGYKLDELHLSEGANNGQAISRILHSRGIRGVLIAPPGADENHPRISLDWKKFCCVLIGGSLTHVGLARVQPDHFYDCILAMQRLRDLHYKRIGLVLPHSMDEHTASQIKSAFQSVHPLGSRKSEKLIFTGNRSNLNHLARWMDQSKPEIVIGNFEEGFPGLDPGNSGARAEIDFAALSWNKNQSAIAGVNQQMAVIGGQAVDLVLSRLERNLFGLDEAAPTTSIPGLWVDSPSIRRIPTEAVA